MSRDYVYDIEAYPNVFVLSAKHRASGKRYCYEISNRRNVVSSLMQWLSYLHENKCRMIGYNNVGFDYPVLDYIIKYRQFVGAAEIYKYVLSLINSDNKFGNAVFDPFVEQVDLYKIHDFDRPTKATSLKALEFNMREENVIDLPFAPGSILTDQEIDTLIDYNWHDVICTDRFCQYSLDQIHFREQLTQKYGRNFMNYNDPKIGKEYFIMEMERSAPGSCYAPGTRKPNQTLRFQIDFKDVVFPWIKFKRPEFQAVCDWFKRQVITETNGVFADISEERLGTLAQYCNLKKCRQPLKKIATDSAGRFVGVPSNATREAAKNGNPYLAWNKVETLHTVVNGFQFDFGTGGIHGSVSSRIVRSDDEYAIYDLDVASFYPNIAIANRVHPLHLGEVFCDVYTDVYNMRKQYKKGSAENGMLKLSLNAVFGQTNNVYSPFFDPQYTMIITVNGQLLLCLLADYLMDIPNLEIIQINTDGVTVKCPRAYKFLLDNICDWWQKHTRLELELAEYKAMFIRDVNNYIAVSHDGKKVKRKGAYAHYFNPPNINKGNGDLDWHQDHSALVIPKAAEAALVNGIDLPYFIRNHEEKFDFMLRAKVNRDCSLYIDNQKVQRITRYYVTQNGGSLIKVMPPLAKAPDKEREIGMCVGYKVKECNDIKQFDRSLIDYSFYIKEAEKLVNALIGGH